MARSLMFLALLYGLPQLTAGHAFIFFPPLRGGPSGNNLNGWCPQCLGSVKLPMDVCGNTKMLAHLSGPTTKLKAGEKVEFQIKVTAHHKGHFRFRLCDKQLSPDSQNVEECLNAHVLERVRPEDSHSDCKPNDLRDDCQPYDEANPGYWYVPPLNRKDTAQDAGPSFTDADADKTEQTDFVEHASMIQLNARASMQIVDDVAESIGTMMGADNVDDNTESTGTMGGAGYRFHYWIPKGFKCDKCTLQWQWKSANSCVPHPDAYNCYFQKMKKLGWNAEEWCPGVCRFDGKCPDKQGPTNPCGEEFSNCADLEIIDEGGTGPSGGPRPTGPPSGPVTTLPPTNPGAASTPQPEPEPEPSSTPAPSAKPPASTGNACVQNTDCDSNPWCKNAGFDVWCEGQLRVGKTCPSPHCKLVSGSGGSQTPAPPPSTTGGPVPTPAPPGPAAPTTTPQAPTGGGGNPTPAPSKECRTCKSECQAKCQLNLKTNQCWGVPRYIECVCTDGSKHKIAGCECEHGNCPSQPGTTPATTSTVEPSQPTSTPAASTDSPSQPATTPAASTDAPSQPATTPATPTDSLIAAVDSALKSSESAGVFMYDTGANPKWVESDLYTWADMTKAVSMMASKGVGNLKLWLGEGSQHTYGLVNIAAFLAQCMQETIQYNACDENNWSDKAVIAKHGGAAYSATSACGQLHQSYQDYTCSAEEDVLAGGKMACDADPDMEMRAATQAKWYGAPGKLFCAPKSKVPKAPRWDSGGWCAQKGGWGYVEPIADDAPLDDYWESVNKGEKCKDYSGQKAGQWKFEGEGCENGSCPSSKMPLFGKPNGRTDVEGCCWWGRGVIQTTGVCNFGKLNYYMGKRAADDGRQALFPKVDFCKNPGAICEKGGPGELKWIAGFFYWLNSVQPYDRGGWNYLDNLKQWVDGGMKKSDTGFINGASGIVNRGCHNPPNCNTGSLHGGPARIKNFEKVLAAMGIKLS